MTVLTGKEKELVAIGTSIAAGCQPCTQHHVRAGLEAGLTPDEVLRAMERAHDVRRRGGVDTCNVGKRLLAAAEQASEWNGRPGDLAESLVYVGAAAGCNAGALLVDYINAARGFGLSDEGVQAALGMTRLVKKGAAMFLEQEVEKALGVTATPEASTSGCCESGCNG